MGLGILNSLAIKVEIEFQQSDGRSPDLTHFQLGVVSSVWLLNNTFQYIDVSTIDFLFSFLMKQWPQRVASNAQKVASISRDWKLEVRRVEWGRDLERNFTKWNYRIIKFCIWMETHGIYSKRFSAGGAGEDIKILGLSSMQISFKWWGNELPLILLVRFRNLERLNVIQFLTKLEFESISSVSRSYDNCIS